MQHFLFEQVDSWFFRESRSMDGSGATAMESVFPPPNNTLLGAIRSRIGNLYHAQHGSTWEDFNKQKKEHSLARIIGYADDYANLQAQGAWLYNRQEQQLYFPCPVNVLQQNNGYGFFALGAPIQCDLGKVRLPSLDFEQGQKAVEKVWIAAVDMQKVLAGRAPERVLSVTDIITTDPRLGIGRNNQTRRINKSELYQTRHIRLKEQWGVYMGLRGLSEEHAQKYVCAQTMMRLGGEARMASVSQLPQEVEKAGIGLPTAPQLTDTVNSLVIYLLTPLPFPDNKEKNLPALPGYAFCKKTDKEGISFWSGVLNDVEVEISSAVVGKTERVGGWNMAQHQSLPVRSFVPAGSCWYVNVANSDQARNIVQALHGKFLTSGRDRALGYGQVVVGLEPKTSVKSE